MNWLDANNEVNNEHFKCKLANKNTSAHPCMQPVHVFHRENKGRYTVIPSPIIEHNQWKKIDITILLGDTNLSRSWMNQYFCCSSLCKQILNESINLLFVILHTDPEWINIFLVHHFAFEPLTVNDWHKNMLHRRSMVSIIWRRNQDGLDLEPMIPYTKTMSSTFGYRGVPESCSEKLLHLWCASQRKPTDTR